MLSLPIQPCYAASFSIRSVHTTGRARRILKMNRFPVWEIVRNRKLPSLYVVFPKHMDFPSENTTENKKPPTAYELRGMLERGEVKLPSVQITLYQDAMPLPDHQIDGRLKVQWGGRDAVFAFEYKATNTPRMLETAVIQANLHAHHTGFLPLVILPYLSEAALTTLDRSGTSGIDLCGNGLLIAENFRFWRSGQPNHYKDSRPIRNPFYGDSSIFARCFLLRDSFSSLSDLGQFAQDCTFDAYPALRQTALTQGTASKVVQSLVDELTVRKVNGGLELHDRRRLLTLLLVPVVGHRTLAGQRHG